MGMPDKFMGITDAEREAYANSENEASEAERADDESKPCFRCKKTICPSHSNINGECIVVTDNGRFIHNDKQFSIIIKKRTQALKGEKIKI